MATTEDRTAARARLIQGFRDSSTRQGLWMARRNELLRRQAATRAAAVTRPGTQMPAQAAMSASQQKAQAIKTKMAAAKAPARSPQAFMAKAGEMIARGVVPPMVNGPHGLQVAPGVDVGKLEEIADQRPPSAQAVAETVADRARAIQAVRAGVTAPVAAPIADQLQIAPAPVSLAPEPAVTAPAVIPMPAPEPAAALAPTMPDIAPTPTGEPIAALPAPAPEPAPMAPSEPVAPMAPPVAPEAQAAPETLPAPPPVAPEAVPAPVAEVAPPQPTQIAPPPEPIVQAPAPAPAQPPIQPPAPEVVAQQGLANDIQAAAPLPAPAEAPAVPLPPPPVPVAPAPAPTAEPAAPAVAPIAAPAPAPAPSPEPVDQSAQLASAIQEAHQPEAAAPPPAPAAPEAPISRYDGAHATGWTSSDLATALRAQPLAPAPTKAPAPAAEPAAPAQPAAAPTPAPAQPPPQPAAPEVSHYDNKHAGGWSPDEISAALKQQNSTGAA